MPNVADTNVAPASVIKSQRWRNDDRIMIWLILKGSKMKRVYTSYLEDTSNIASLIPDQQQNKLFIQ